MTRRFSNAGLTWQVPHKRQRPCDKEMSELREGDLVVTTKESWWGEGTFWHIQDIEVESPDNVTVWASKAGSWAWPCSAPPGYDESANAAEATETSFTGGDLRRPTPDEESQRLSELVNKRLDDEEKKRRDRRHRRRERSASKSVYTMRQARERNSRFDSPSRSAAPSRSTGVARPSCAPERRAPTTPPIPPKARPSQAPDKRGSDKDVSSGPLRRGRSPSRARPEQKRTRATSSKENDMSWADFKAVRGIVVNLPASQ
jgi:hypothetical protein